MIPIVAIGTILQDAQVRFLKIISFRSVLVNRAIGLTIVLSGLGLFIVR